jgi:hypothetical protein
MPKVAQSKPLVAPPPTGAIVETSGNWTITAAPDSPPPPPEPPRPTSELSYYAELAGVSNEEAARRIKEQEAFRPEFDRLTARLRREERGNFLSAELVHRPDWAFLLYFRRDPETTLARYTRNPRVQARQGGAYTQSELQAVTRPWVDRLSAERLFTGLGLNTAQGRIDVDMVVSEEKFRVIAAKRGWEPVPPTVFLRFPLAPVASAITEDAATGLRLFPQNDRLLGAVNMAALHGRIVLRDGCFFVDDSLPDGRPMLAYFPREVGLYRDAQGYLALRSRIVQATGRHLGRIGERFTWAGPIAASEDLPMVRELRARCGTAPLVRLSIPESQSILHARYPHLRHPVPLPQPPRPGLKQ